jgi:hypothetical protein
VEEVSLMAADPNLVYMIKEDVWKSGKGPHPGPPPPGYTATYGRSSEVAPGGPDDGETSAEAALKKLQSVAGAAAQVITDIALEANNPPAVRLNAAKYVLDTVKAVKGASGDPLLDMVRTFQDAQKKTE